MSNRAREVHRSGVDSNDLVHTQHGRGAVGEVFEVPSSDRRPSWRRLLDLHTEKLRIGIEMYKELLEFNFTRIVTSAWFAHRPGKPDAFALAGDPCAPLVDQRDRRGEVRHI